MHDILKRLKKLEQHKPQGFHEDYSELTDQELERCIACLDKGESIPGELQARIKRKPGKFDLSYLSDDELLRMIEMCSQ